MFQLGSGIGVAATNQLAGHFDQPQADVLVSVRAAPKSAADSSGQATAQALDGSGRSQAGSTGIVVGVVDSGLDYTHRDLYLNVWLNQGEIPQALRASLIDIDGDRLITFHDLNDIRNSALVSDHNGNGRIDAGDLLSDGRWENGFDEDRNGFVDDLIGWDFAHGDNDPFDDNGHGTHVAGTIAAFSASGGTVPGAGFATQIVALKFITANGSGSLGGAVSALDYFTAAAKASQFQKFVATNNSWGNGHHYQDLLDAVVRGAKENILFVGAAGNGGDDARGDSNDLSPHYPSNYDTSAGAGYDAVISVAALDRSGALANYSNFGATSVDLGAPGSYVRSTVPGDNYATYTGTSMAAPHVTAAIALYAAISNDSAVEIKAKLLGSTVAIPSLEGQSVSGGRLDLAAFLSKAAPAPVEAGPSNPAPGPSSPVPETPAKAAPAPAELVAIYGSSGNDLVVGTSASEKISGLPGTGSHLGMYTIDTLVGGGGSDIFVLGDERGRFYDDDMYGRSGRWDYAIIKDFDADDKIQLAKGEYVQNAIDLRGVSGMGIYHDSNGNGRFDDQDELLAIVEGATAPLSSDLFLFL